MATDNVRLRLTLDGDRLAGRFESNIKELAGGAVIFTVRGRFAAERITV